MCGRKTALITMVCGLSVCDVCGGEAVRGNFKLYE